MRRQMQALTWFARKLSPRAWSPPLPSAGMRAPIEATQRALVPAFFYPGVARIQFGAWRSTFCGGIHGDRSNQ